MYLFLVFAFSSSDCSHGEAGVIEKSSELVICDSPGFSMSLLPQNSRAKKLLVSLGGIGKIIKTVNLLIKVILWSKFSCDFSDFSLETVEESRTGALNLVD